MPGASVTHSLSSGTQTLVTSGLVAIVDVSKTVWLLRSPS